MGANQKTPGALGKAQADRPLNKRRIMGRGRGKAGTRTSPERKLELMAVGTSSAKKPQDFYSMAC